MHVIFDQNIVRYLTAYIMPIKIDIKLIRILNIKAMIYWVKNELTFFYAFSSVNIFMSFISHNNNFNITQRLIESVEWESD